LSESIPLENDRRFKTSYPIEETTFHRVLVATIKAIFKSLMKMEVTGMENLPKKGAVIVAANHVTNMDIFPMQLALNRPIFFMGKAELFQNSLVHYLFRNLGAFPVYRGERDEWAFQHSLRLLHAGQVLGMFPEGTRSRGRGLKVAKTGAARLSIDVQCPLIPMSIDGSQRFFKGFPRRNQVTIIIGEEILPEKGELPISLTDRLMFQMARNLPVELRGVYAE